MQGKTRKVDKRIFRTKQAIRNAFLSLLTEKDVEKITVGEIAVRANIDRKTVYNYYTGIYGILDEISKELADDFEKVIEVVENKRENSMQVLLPVQPIQFQQRPLQLKRLFLQQ